MLFYSACRKALLQAKTRTHPELSLSTKGQSSEASTEPRRSHKQLMQYSVYLHKGASNRPLMAICSQRPPMVRSACVHRLRSRHSVLSFRCMAQLAHAMPAVQQDVASFMRWVHRCNNGILHTIGPLADCRAQTWRRRA